MDPNNQASSLLLEVVSCKDVCETNNQAVLDLDRGCYSSALVTMTSAVRKLKIFIGNTEHDEAETISSPGASAECVFCVPFSFKSNANDYENEGALELFQFAFMIATPYIGDFESNADLLSKVVLYNLGICYHLFGMTQRNTYKLKTALECYCMAIEVVEKYSTNGKYEDDNVRFLMALLNNMGHLYNYFMDVRNLNQCIRALKKLISSEIVEALSLSDEHDYQNFFKFLFVLPDNLLSISPAA